MRPIVSVVLALIASLLMWFSVSLYKRRRRMAGLPGPPHHPLLGHLLIAADCAQQFPADCHPHLYVDYIRRKYNLGNIIYVDFWPIGPQMIYIIEPEMSNQVTITHSLPKSSMLIDYLAKLLGYNNMVGLDGAAWKVLRAMFNPGFASGHLMTLAPYMVDAAVIFGDILREKAKTGELIEMEELATRLTVDIIGKITLDVDFNSQLSNNKTVSTFRTLIGLLPPTSDINPFAGLNPVRWSRLWYNSYKLDRYIGEAIDERYTNRQKSASEQSRTKSKKKDRYVVDLALDTYEKDFQDPKLAAKIAKTGMDPTFRRSAIDQVKTFIFAGHDTTSSVVACIFYFMNLYPNSHARVVEELDRVFGPLNGSSTAAEKIRQDPHIIHQLHYCTAIIKETTRIFPPASSVRQSDGFELTDPVTEQKHPTAGFHVWPVVHAIHRNEEYFPEPEKFVPERFIPGESPFPNAKAHKDAWRAFERGPRNCIGQELALIEIKIIMALTLREFDFIAEYPKLATPEEEARYSPYGRRCYQILKASAKPKDGLPGRVKLR